MTGLAALSLATGGLSWGLGYFGQPHLLIRYMAISSVKEVKKARWIASMWAIPGISGAFLIGIVGMAYFGEDFFIGKDPEIIMPLLAQTLLPGWLAGLLTVTKKTKPVKNWEDPDAEWEDPDKRDERSKEELDLELLNKFNFTFN